MKEELTKEQKKIIEQVHKKPDKSLFISRMPLKTKEEFMSCADREFDGDYGFALKHLWDAFNGQVNFLNTEIGVEIERINNELALLKKGVSVSAPEKKEYETSVDGSMKWEKKNGN